MTSTEHINRIAAPEFWRFVFIMAIALLHFEEDLYNRVHMIGEGGYLGVEFFFLLSGFLIAMQYKASTDNYSPKANLMNRIKSVFPDYLIGIILMTILWACTEASGVMDVIKHVYHNRLQFIFAWPFLKYGNLEMRSLWFITYWIVLYGIISFFIQFLSRGGRTVLVLGSALVFAYYAANHGSLFCDPNVSLFIEPRLLRSAATMCIGIGLYDMYEQVGRIQLSKLGYVLLSLFEIFVVSDCAFMMLFYSRELADFVVVLCMCIIILFSFARKTWLSQMLDNNFSRFLGRLSMPIFVYHLIVIYIIQYYLRPYMHGGIAIYSVFVVLVILFSWGMGELTRRYFKPGLEKLVASLYRNE